MKVQPVILAGGSGTRLWPASRQHHPKQLLPLAGERTLLQETAVRLRDVPELAVDPDPVVVTSEEYRFIVSDQLRQMGIERPRIVLEPLGRNTAPALTLAALLDLAQGDDDVLLVMPADHLIADLPAFRAAVAEGAQQAEASKMVTFGVVPDHPDTGYGYIKAGARVIDAASAKTLAGFAEKPDAATAESYLAAGDYLWNSGIFMMKSSVWLTAMDQLQPAMGGSCRLALKESLQDGQFVRLGKEAFAACPADSIDYAVMEKLGAGAAVVIPLDAGWSDVGGWGSLWTVAVKDEAGNVTRGEVILEDTRGTLVHAESRLVTVLGADDLVVVETADAVLVARRDRAHDLKKLVEQVREKDEGLTQFHRRIHRPWGYYEQLDSGRRYQVKRILVSPGASLSLQYHNKRAEHWVVVHGTAEVTCGDTVSTLGENESTYIPVGTPHRLHNPGTEPLEIIEVQSGEYLGEDDIVRLEDHYGR